MTLKVKNKKAFGPFIRELRIKYDLSQRKFAQKIGIAPSYLNDIEKEKRSAPKQIVIKKISTLLKTNLNNLNDLAGISKKEIAPDISAFIEQNPKVVSLLRSIKDNNLKDDEIINLESSINKSIQ